MRERSFPSSPDITSTARKLCSLLGLAGDTGTLLLDMNNGGIGTIRFQEKHKL